MVGGFCGALHGFTYKRHMRCCIVGSKLYIQKESRNADIIYAICVSVTQLIISIICAVLGYGSYAEYILVFIVPACMVVRPVKNLVYINIIMVILSGFHMTGMFYGYF